MKIVFELVLQSLQVAVRTPGGQVASGVLHFPPGSVEEVSVVPERPTTVVRRRADVTREKILALRTQGLSNREIMEELGCGSATLQNRLHGSKKHLRLPVDADAKRISKLPTLTRKLLKGWQSGRSGKELAKKHKISTGAVFSRLQGIRKLGISTDRLQAYRLPAGEEAKLLRAAGLNNKEK